MRVHAVEVFVTTKVQKTKAWAVKNGIWRSAFVALACALLCGVCPPRSAADAPEAEGTEQQAAAAGEVLDYQQYIADHASAARPSGEVAVDIADCEGGSPTEEQGRLGILTADDETVTWQVHVPQAGLYQLRIAYCTAQSKGTTIERSILIDGALPFQEAAGVALQRFWRDDASDLQEDGRRFEKDKNGNELLPEQEEESVWLETYACDPAGYVEEPLSFYFTEGEHTLSLEAMREPVIIGGLTLCQSEPVPDYSEYIAQYDGQPRIEQGLQILQAEDYAAKSDANIVPLNDRSSASTQPSDPSKIRLNTIGGYNWSANGQWIEWTFTVPETGLYRLALKYRQNFLSGMTANRRLLIDGEVPFAQAQTLLFPYHSSWQQEVIGDDSGDFYFYFEAGETHTLRLECSLGGAAPLLQSAQEIVTGLNTVYRKLVMYTGTVPDVNRDYQIETVLPEVVEDIQTNYTALTALSDDLVSFAGARGDANVVIDSLSDLLRRMLDDTRDIPRLMSALRDNIGSLASWVLTQSRQALQLDYLAVLGTEDALPRPNDTFFQSVAYNVRVFLSSFFEDYSMMSTEEGQTSIDVWVNTGRDQATIIKNMISNRFTPQYGVGVNLKLTNGQLLMATIAGEGPDVALMNPSSDVVNYALRGAVEPLDDYPGFSELAQEFDDSTFVPLRYGGDTFGLPETQTFPMMFYRTDVLAELGISVPNTWQELYAAIGELQKNNHEFGFPVSAPGSSVIGYSPSLAGFTTLLYQNGGSLYTPENDGTGLFSKEAAETFQQWTRLFTTYDLRVEYDAATSFRSGEMPLLIADYTLYNTLSVFAPEIKGQWGFTSVPGTPKEDGLDRTVAAGGSGCILLKQSEHKDEAWSFLRWWAGSETQAEYGRQLENVLGPSARYAAANLEAFEQLPWRSADYKAILEQRSQAKGIPEVPGGYYTSRHIENAFRRVINYGDNEYETLLDYAKMIDDEIKYKRRELGLE